MSASPLNPRSAKFLFLLFPAIFLGAVNAGAAPKVYIDITKEEARKMVIASMPFSVGESEEEKELRAVLERDLALTGYLTLLPMQALQKDLYSMETESGRINFASWVSWGSELLLRTRYEHKAGEVIVQGRLYDTASEKEVLAREYRVSGGKGAGAVHSLVDDIVKILTGREGIARTRIALAWAEKGPKRISIMDYDGRGLRPVSPEGVLSLYPAWFPDSRRICYVTYRFGRTEIVVHDLKTGRIRSLAFFPGMNAFPAVSPDGEHLLLTLSRDGNPEIYRMRADASSLKRLTFSKAVEASPSWSPDQKRMAFVSDRTGSPQIYIASADGGRARRVSYTGTYSSSPDWSPDGERIVFTSMVDGTFQLFVIDLATGENVQLTGGGGNKEDPSWAPDGIHLVFSQGRGSTYRPVILDSRSGERFDLPRRPGTLTSPSWSP